jgi:hypothetical protein
MKTINKKEPTMWQLEHWYEKTVYVLGYIWVACFTIGFIAGIISSLE